LFTAQLGGAVRRHCHSTGDMLGGTTDSSRLQTSTPPIRLRPSRPKSEGSFSGDGLRVKRASSFGVNILHCLIIDYILSAINKCVVIASHITHGHVDLAFVRLCKLW